LGFHPSSYTAQRNGSLPFKNDYWKTRKTTVN
jgi:hypothetical protein